MARLPYLNREDLQLEDRDIYDDLTAKRGSVINIFRVLAHAPGLLRRLLTYSDYVRHDLHLDPSVREILQGVTGSALGVPNVLRAMANHPGALRDGAQVAYRPGSLITPAQRELAYLTASVANRCHY